MKKNKTLILTDWQDFYDTIPSKADSRSYVWTAYQQTNQPISNPSVNCLYICYSIFTDCSSTDNGGVLSYSYTNAGKILIEYSTFIDCSAVTNGGSLYLNNTSSDCILNCICSFKSLAKDGIFIYTNLFNHKTNKVIQTSVCSTDIGQGSSAPINLMGGHQECTSINVSNHHVDMTSALYSHCDSAESFIKFCSFNSGHSDTNYCGFFTGEKQTIEKCNVIHNKIESAQFGIITCISNTMIIDCCLLNNTGNLICSYSYQTSTPTITLIDCTLPSYYTIVFTSSQMSVEGTGTIITNNARADQSFIHGFVLTEYAEYCRAGQDSVSGLTPPPYVTATHTPILLAQRTAFRATHHFFFTLQLLIFIFVSSFPS